MITRIVVVYVLAFAIVIGRDVTQRRADWWFGLWWWAADQIASMRTERVVIVEKHIVEREIVERVIRQSSPVLQPGMGPPAAMMSIVTMPNTRWISSVY